jgi:hypothetical protein
LIGPQRRCNVDHMGGRRHAGEVELANLVDVVEHVGELAGHSLKLIVRELEPGETGNVEDLIAIEHPGRF